ncbi:nitrate- and nitrite sensing domain-containing protein [Micromonospora costi]|uniref:nitrate- and nitrite sensing domain-containing protein n=1 Tax=Micromonospora costi TaxID=1530042 RepID=UPI001319F65C|nr:nitrate- and nitrite sensing domain-containing protein [Micromonospora costi]
MSGQGTTTEGQRLRRLLAAAAVVLVALWAYASYVAGRDAADLLRIRALAETLGQPTDRLILDLQDERRLTGGAVAGGPRERSALVVARNDTDRTVAALRDATGGTDLRLLTAGAVRDRADELLRQLDALAALRADADAGRAEAVAGYDTLLDAAFAVYGPEWGARESRLAAENRAVVALARSRELLAREDTLVTAALAGGRISADDRRRLTELIGMREYASSEAVAVLPARDRDDHRSMVEGQRFTALRALEDRLLGGDDRPALGVDGWQAVVEPALDELHALVQSTARHSVERATPGAALVVTRAGLVLGLGLVAVLTLLLTGIASVRRLAGGGAFAPEPGPPAPAHGAGPGAAVPAPVADRPAAPAPHRPAAPGPVPGPGWAGPAPAGTAWAGASDGPPAPGSTPAPAPGRPGPTAATASLFLRITQRNQALLREQLSLLDAMERRERSPEEAAELFHLDHLATRLRRNVEKLVTLAGVRPARRWRRPVPMLDVARGAVAEVADYQRVLVAPQWPWSLAGRAVTDVIHLLAELIENALVFSPAGTAVRLAGEHRPGGCAVVVTDDGRGLTPEALAAANRILAEPPTAGPPSGHAGLYAAALLAARCGARVSLRPGPRGGTAAVVLLPTTLVTPTGPTGAAPGPGSRPTPSARPAAGTGVTGDLPVRTRHPGSVWPGPATVGSDTVEMPVPRAARGLS